MLNAFVHMSQYKMLCVCWLCTLSSWILSQTLSHILHLNFLGFLLHLRPNLCVLKFPLVETLSLFGLSFVALFGCGVFADGGFGAGSGVAAGLASGLGTMFLADLQRGVTGGGFVTKLSASICAELSSLFGCIFMCFLDTGLLSSSLLRFPSCSYDMFELAL